MFAVPNLSKSYTTHLKGGSLHKNRSELGEQGINMVNIGLCPI